ncbi:hypothetical protein F5Y12DRAFT_197363 [Xylaria sp. FL1777]|nr:hypothetical protein F5Y12DRAFT_197363 [Xylaria sp. FL1777]
MPMVYFYYDPDLPVDFAFTASVFLLRASESSKKNTVTCKILQDEIFRDNGEAQPGCLEIPLELFIPTTLRSQILNGQDRATSIRIDFQELNEWATEAEQSLRIRKYPSPPARRAKAEFIRDGKTITMSELIALKGLE